MIVLGIGAQVRMFSSIRVLVIPPLSTVPPTQFRLVFLLLLLALTLTPTSVLPFVVSLDHRNVRPQNKTVHCVALLTTPLPLGPGLPEVTPLPPPDLSPTLLRVVILTLVLLLLAPTPTSATTSLSPLVVSPALQND